MRARRARGFTLIEILIAIVILAVAMGACIAGMTQYANNAARLRDRTVAIWVAHNRLAEMLLEPAYPELGRSDGDVEMAGRKWRWEAAVIETADPDVRRIDLQIFAQDEKQPAATLSGFRAHLS